MEHKKRGSKAKNAGKSDHSSHKTTNSHAKSDSHKSDAATTPENMNTAISNGPEDMAVLSNAQRAEVFDMSSSENPDGDRLAVQDARIQAALEPVGTAAAIEPIVTEDGVITPNAG